ncbi:MAG: hypothetical protein F9K17_15890 [Phycisphaerae bacterium]|nr:MAG: hypothetical protein F9K17_15890 [Phycisphaerae bacterium]
MQPDAHERIRPGDKIAINGRTLSSPRGFMLVKRGRLREVSITVVAADPNTSVAIAASRFRKERGMDTDVLNVNEEAIRASERERLKMIEATCRPPVGGWGRFQQKVDELKAAAVAGEIERNDLSAELLSILRDSRPKTSVAAPGPTVDNSTVLEAALLRRMGLETLGEKTLGALAMEHGARLRASHVLDLCRTALQLEGHDVPSGREEMVRASLSTISLPTALSNLANKLLLESYEESPATWQVFAATRSVSDFKTNTAIRPSFTGSLQQVAPGGELKHGSATEWYAEFRADTYGRLFSVDRRDLINDDLGTFDEVARASGRAAMRKLNDLVYEVLLANGGDFFSTNNGNYIEGAGAVLSFDSLSEAIGLMMTQRDAEGNDLDLRPKTLLVPPELQPQAKALLESEFLQQVAENAPTGNSLRRAVSVEVEPRLSNTVKYAAAASDKHWYLFSAPSNVPMIVAFLQGKQTPTVEFFGLDQDANRLAVTWRVYFDFGAALVDPRAAVHSKGE